MVLIQVMSLLTNTNCQQPCLSIVPVTLQSCQSKQLLSHWLQHIASQNTCATA